jgi:hypothetical protein
MSSNDGGGIGYVLRIDMRKVTNLVLQSELLRILMNVWDGTFFGHDGAS